MTTKETPPPSKPARRWWRRLRRAVFWLVLGWLLVVALLLIVIYSYGFYDTRQKSDVIVVLGAGVQPDGSPGWALTRRANQGADLWEQGYAPVILCTGSQAYNRPRSEAAACREILLSRGIPAEAIFSEEQSRSTEENAIYTHEIMQKQGWQTVLLVTDSYHIFRSSWLFSLEGIAHTISPVPMAEINSWSFYGYSAVREIFALHWQAVKELFQIPTTYVALM